MAARHELRFITADGELQRRAAFVRDEPQRFGPRLSGPI